MEGSGPLGFRRMSLSSDGLVSQLACSSVLDTDKPGRASPETRSLPAPCSPVQ
jgi:hypothetical protein